MVLPWLIVGAAGALEARRRATGTSTIGEGEVRRLQEAERGLQRKQQELNQDLQEAVRLLEEEKAGREDDQRRVQDLERLKVEIEKRMTEMSTLVADMTRENEHLRSENVALEDKANSYLLANEALENSAQALKRENAGLIEQLEAMTSEDREAHVKEMMQELRDAITEAMQAFTAGDCDAAGLKARLEDLGVVLDCSTEQLARIQHDEPASQAIQDDLNDKFESQMLLVMDDRNRLEHLMGIAHNLRLPGSPAPAAPAAQQLEKLTLVQQTAPADQRAAPGQLNPLIAALQEPEAAAASAGVGGFFKAFGWGGAITDAAITAARPEGGLLRSSDSGADGKPPAVLLAAHMAAAWSGVSSGELAEQLHIATAPEDTSTQITSSSGTSVTSSNNLDAPMLPAGALVGGKSGTDSGEGNGALPKKTKPKGMFGFRFKGAENRRPSSEDVNVKDGFLPRMGFMDHDDDFTDRTLALK